jgi:hypothetical protein
MQAQCWLAAGSRSYRPLIGITPVPQSAPQPVSYILLYHPGRRDFPDPVGSEDISSWGLPVTPSVQAMVRIRCLRVGLLHASSGWLATDFPDSEFRSGLPLQTAFAQGSFAPEALPSFIATTSPCADPGASHLPFALRTYGKCPCRLHHPQLVTGTVPLWSAFLSWSAAPLVPAVRRVHVTSSSPSTSAFASLRWLGSSARPPTQRLLVGLPFRYGRHSFMLRPSSLLALLTVRHLQLAPEDVLHPSFLSIRYLLDSRVCYPADWSIAGAGLSPARKAAAVGCTVVQVDVRKQR